MSFQNDVDNERGKDLATVKAFAAVEESLKPAADVGSADGRQYIQIGDDESVAALPREKRNLKSGFSRVTDFVSTLFNKPQYSNTTRTQVFRAFTCMVNDYQWRPGSLFSRIASIIINLFFQGDDNDLLHISLRTHKGIFLRAKQTIAAALPQGVKRWEEVQSQLAQLKEEGFKLRGGNPEKRKQGFIKSLDGGGPGETFLKNIYNRLPPDVKEKSLTEIVQYLRRSLVSLPEIENADNNYQQLAEASAEAVTKLDEIENASRKAWKAVAVSIAQDACDLINRERGLTQEISELEQTLSVLSQSLSVLSQNRKLPKVPCFTGEENGIIKKADGDLTQLSNSYAKEKEEVMSRLGLLGVDVVETSEDGSLKLVASNPLGIFDVFLKEHEDLQEYHEIIKRQQLPRASFPKLENYPLYMTSHLNQIRAAIAGSSKNEDTKKKLNDKIDAFTKEFEERWTGIKEELEIYDLADFNRSQIAIKRRALLSALTVNN